MTVRDKVKVAAILGEDLVCLIDELHLRREFEGGECHCHFCNDVVDYTNLKLLFPTKDHIVGFLCNKPKCFVEFALQE